MARTWTATAVSVLLAASIAASGSGCNGLMVVKRGPKAGELNWFGRAFVWTGDQSDKIGLTEEVEVEGAHDAPAMENDR